MIKGLIIIFTKEEKTLENLNKVLELLGDEWGRGSREFWINSVHTIGVCYAKDTSTYLNIYVNEADGAELTLTKFFEKYDVKHLEDMTPEFEGEIETLNELNKDSEELTYAEAKKPLYGIGEEAKPKEANDNTETVVEEDPLLNDLEPTDSINTGRSLEQIYHEINKQGEEDGTLTDEGSIAETLSITDLDGKDNIAHFAKYGFEVPEFEIELIKIYGDNILCVVQNIGNQAIWIDKRTGYYGKTWDGKYNLIPIKPKEEIKFPALILWDNGEMDILKSEREHSELVQYPMNFRLATQEEKDSLHCSGKE
jgi:hypothetical protein